MWTILSDRNCRLRLRRKSHHVLKNFASQEKRNGIVLIDGTLVQSKRQEFLLA
jgi:hypothetical protein